MNIKIKIILPWILLLGIFIIGAATKQVIGPSSSTTTHAIARWTDTSAWKVDNSLVIIDNNGWSAERKTCVSNCTEGVCYTDGNNVLELYNQLLQLPKILVCNTIKGCGIPSIYNSPLLHHVTPNESNINQFRKGLDEHSKR